uniref:membrane-spanning 4-domains subfamily A member 13 n=1 Tax=Ictidomys tridecemlineatus TaxID=43179 RepID=UPI001A9E15C9|nr:membrane-spanning 4-domains subfamily A member 13 [Ictidomys tridecemlineatus]
MACGNTSTADSLVLGAIQIMIGIFHIFMWYFLLVLYMGQIKGVFGTYEPITYKTGCAFWGIFYIVSGASTIRSTQKSSQYLTIWALIMNIFSVITAFIALCLTVFELSTFHSVSYRNYGQAKLGREVSRILLASYLLEIGIALAHSICCCARLNETEDQRTRRSSSLQLNKKTRSARASKEQTEDLRKPHSRSSFLSLSKKSSSTRASQVSES